MKADQLTRQDWQIIDGFILNPAIYYLPYFYTAMALAQMETLRRANLYRARWYVAPADIQQTIAAYDTNEMQIVVTPGSWLWGLSYNEYDDAYAITAGNNSLIQITDSCTGVPLFHEYASGRGNTGYRNVTDYRAGVMPTLLTEPRCVVEPGLVNVEVANRSNAAIRAQLVLFFAEPCVVSGKVSDEQQVGGDNYGKGIMTTGQLAGVRRNR
jgi:hypothetical protein